MNKTTTIKIVAIVLAIVVCVTLLKSMLEPKEVTSPSVEKVGEDRDTLLKNSDVIVTKEISAEEEQILADHEAELEAQYQNYLAENGLFAEDKTVSEKTIISKSTADEIPVEAFIPDMENDTQLLLAQSDIQNAPTEPPARPALYTLPTGMIEVRTVSGQLASGFELTDTCKSSACQEKIIKSATNEVVWDRIWKRGFVVTHNGQQVITTTISN